LNGDSESVMERVAEGANAFANVDVTQRNLPLFIYGYWPDGTPFYEETQSIATTTRGGLVSMRTPMQRGQRLLITNKENECSQECVVEFVGANLARGVDVAFEFSVPTPHFWTVLEIDTEQRVPSNLQVEAAAELGKDSTGETTKAC